MRVRKGAYPKRPKQWALNKCAASSEGEPRESQGFLEEVRFGPKFTGYLDTSQAQLEVQGSASQNFTSSSSFRPFLAPDKTAFM